MAAGQAKKSGKRRKKKFWLVAFTEIQVREAHVLAC